MAEITPDIASKVLSADLRNLIKKIGDGGNLSSPEREMMQRFIGTVEVTEDHARLRLSSLLRKWSLGQRLTKEELAEISGLLPDTAEIAKRKTKETYKRRLEDYEPIYGQKPNRARTIKRWIKAGRETTPPDLPPLDEPSLMPAWWMRHMKQKVPDKVLSAAGQSAAAKPQPKLNEAPANAADPSPPPPDTTASNPQRAPRKPVETHEVGFAAKLRQAEQDVADALSDKTAAESEEPPDTSASSPVFGKTLHPARYDPQR